MPVQNRPVVNQDILELQDVLLDIDGGPNGGQQARQLDLARVETQPLTL